MGKEEIVLMRISYVSCGGKKKDYLRSPVRLFLEKKKKTNEKVVQRILRGILICFRLRRVGGRKEQDHVYEEERPDDETENERSSGVYTPQKEERQHERVATKKEYHSVSDSKKGRVFFEEGKA